MKRELNFTTPYYKGTDDNFLETLSSDLMDVCIARDTLNHYDEEGTEVLNTERSVILRMESELTTLLKVYIKSEDDNFDLHVVEDAETKAFYLVDNNNNVYYDTEETHDLSSCRRFAITRYLIGTRMQIEERIKENKQRLATITVHAKNAQLTATNARKLSVCTIVDVCHDFLNPESNETVIWYMDNGENESMIVEETVDEVKELIRKAEEI